MKLRVTLKKSPIGYPKDQKATLRALKLNKLNKTRDFEVTPSVIGMLNKIKHLVEIKEVSDDETL
ncbi:50S ribosomal protein L30 [bacterium]|nr:50S ribosomal protein L30 [bacterium]